MNKFMFNHKLMLSPQNKTNLFEQKMRLPKVLAFFSLESVLQAPNNNDEQIFKKFYFMANTFNASLLSLQKQDLDNVERDIVREFSQIRVSSIQDINHLKNQVQYSLEFQQKARKYLSFRRDGKPRVTCLTESIVKKKKLKPYQFLQTGFAKITLDEAPSVLIEFNENVLEQMKNEQIDTQNIQQNPKYESVQWVYNKVIYFSSRIQSDYLPVEESVQEDDLKELATLVAIPSQQENSGNQLSWINSNHIFLKKEQSESQAALEMCKIQYQLGQLDSNLRPQIPKLAEQINPSECSLDGENRDEILSIFIITNKSDSINPFQTTAFTEYEESLDAAASSYHWKTKFAEYYSKPYFQRIILSEDDTKIEGKIYYTANFGKLQIMRLRFSKQKKTKIQEFYTNLRCYLEDACKEFEFEFFSSRKEDYSRHPTKDQWLDFNKTYRKSWQMNQIL